MPLPTDTEFDRRFCRGLLTTRRKIETLPEAQRPFFRKLADEAEAHQRSMKSDCLKIQAIVDDLSLRAAAMDFTLWSAAKDIRRVLAASGFHDDRSV